MIETIKEKLEDLYLNIPYEWRPPQLWNRLKCWVFKPYTTIKPRYLEHTWTDKDRLLEHMVFEILSLYIEKEKPGERIDWEFDEAHSNAWKEMNEIYHWWHKIYIPWSETYMDKYEFPEQKFERITNSDNFRLVYKSEEDKKKYHEMSQQIHEEEQNMLNKLTENCKRVIDLRGFLWT